MKPQKITDSYYVSCPRGLESLVEEEVSGLKVKEIISQDGGIHFSAYNEKAIEFLLTTRYANRILKKIYSFTIEKEKDLYHLARDIKWKAYFDLHQTFKLKTTLGSTQFKNHHGKTYKQRSKFHNPLIISQIFKDGIVDRFRDDLGNRPSVDRHNPQVSIYLHVAPDEDNARAERVTVMLDLCGGSLSQRGYRHIDAQAPLKENLAAALAAFSGWTPQGHTNPLWDITCGSATLLIESLLKAYAIPPTYLNLGRKHYPWIFQNLKWYQQDKYLKQNFENIITKLEGQIQQGFQALAADRKQEVFVKGFDVSAKAIAIGQEQVDRAQLSQYITLHKENCLGVIPSQPQGVILSNLPFGVRVEGEHDEGLENFYHDLGEHIKNKFKGWCAYFFMEHSNLPKKIELKGDQRKILFNGPIECRFIRYRLF